MQTKPYNHLNHATQETNELLGIILHTNFPTAKTR